MGKDPRLVNIYLKINNKRPITMDDLGYLAEYDPECFAKTCQNVVYNIPETKSIMAPADDLESINAQPKPELSGRQTIEKILENLKNLEMNGFPDANIDHEKVKSLLGNLYMELLFPHNDNYTFINMADNENTSLFDRKV